MIDSHCQGETGAWKLEIAGSIAVSIARPKTPKYINIGEKVFEMRVFTHSHWLYLDLAEMKKHTSILAKKDSLSSRTPDGRGDDVRQRS